MRLAGRRAGLQKLARSVSDPASPRYGQYVTPERTASRFGARKATRRAVRSFLHRHGVPARIDVTRSFAQAFLSAHKARRLFGRIDGPTGRIPRALRGRVRVVLQQEAFSGDFLPHRPGPASRRGSAPLEPDLEPPYVRTGTPAGCEQGRNATYQPDGAPETGPAFTPNQIQAAYGASSLHAQGVTGQRVRAGILIDGFARDELRAFTACFGIEMPPTRLATVGRRSAGETSIESALDLQMITLMAPGLARLTVYAVGSGYWPAEFSAMLDRGNAADGRLPHVISVSEGDCESDLGRDQVELTELVLASAAAAGVTVVAGSGDSGSFCTSGPVGFYPSSSRWVTSVGGTALTLEVSNAIADEVVWNDSALGVPFAGGGGYSTYLRAPAYQRGLSTWGDRRGYPDVAAMADGYPAIAVYCGVADDGTCAPTPGANPFQAVGNGTSTATPLVAGGVALANQRRREMGDPRLGFVNPLFYALGDQPQGPLRDIVDGSNDLGFGCCDAGPGYDLASGWGSVNAERLAGLP